MRVCLGGTFHPFHAGHAALLDATLDADEVFIGVTQGTLSKRARDVPPWNERAARIERHYKDAGFKGYVMVRALDDAVGPAATQAYDAIVVSPETVPGAEKINAQRQSAGLPLLDVRVVTHVVAQDLLVLSGTRIHGGDVDVAGKRLTPVRVAVGSANPVKVDAVRAQVQDILGCDVDARGFEVSSQVPEQPREHETLHGAQARAHAAFAAWPEADYAVGIEAGLNQDPEERAWYDVQACVVLDAGGRETDGWGPAFQYPGWVTARALSGEMISDILGPVANDDRIGSTTGAIGFLTEGRMDRKALTGVAVLMAFVPRLKPELYGSRPGL